MLRIYNDDRFAFRKDEQMKEGFKEGSIVQVNINSAKMTLCGKALVLYVPVATGDSWIFKDLFKNRIVQTSEPITLTPYTEAF